VPVGDGDCTPSNRRPVPTSITMDKVRRRCMISASLALARPGLSCASTAMPEPGCWLELPGTSMCQVAPQRDGHPAWGTIGPRAVTDAWGGAAFDARRQVLMLHGGGHGDYGGNEVYEFHLVGRHWVRATDPSALRDLGNGRFEVLGSEAPVSSHSYDGLTYLPDSGEVFKFGGSCYSNGSAYDRHAYLYQPAQRRWKRMSPAPRACLQVVSDHDPVTRRVVVGTGSGLMWFDAASDRWALGSQGNANLSSSGGVCVTESNRFVQMQARTGAIDFFDLGSPARRWPSPLSGAQPWARHPGMVYLPQRQRIVVWSGGPQVWLIDPADWGVTELRAACGAAPATHFADGRRRSAGIYSRWQYVAAQDLFIGYAHCHDNVWLYRLPR
jgi:hypothetical protein